jgi:hypothetical protein
MKPRRRPQSPPQIAVRFPPDHDDPEQIERLIRLEPGFPYFELKELGRTLEAEGFIVPGYIPPPVGPCNPDSFLYEAHFESTKKILLIDRNIASRMVKVVDGSTMDDMLRKVAALKVFCHFLDVLIEPSIAFHELAQAHGNDEANRELARFRDADNDEPDTWLDLAFGDLDALQRRPITQLPEAHDFEFPLRRWKRNYVVALKIAELELNGGTNLGRMLDLLSWMRDTFVIVGPAALLAAVYFAPNSPKRKGLLKQLRSPDRSRAIDGVRNAAWDLTYLGELVSKVNDAYGTKTRLMFASFDLALRDLARLAFRFPEGQGNASFMTEALALHWNPRDARLIADALFALVSLATDPGRTEGRATRTAAITTFIDKGEAVVMRAGPAP